jgi:hypothetical protein
LRAIFAEELIAPRLAVIDAILRDAETRGEVKPGSVTPLIARVGPALIVQHFMLTGEPPSRSDLTQIIDTVLPQSCTHPDDQRVRRSAGS